MGFNNYIRSLREEKGLSQLAIAEELGVSVTTIKNAECGATERPNSKFLESLSKYLDDDKVKVYRDIIFNSYFPSAPYKQSPFVDLLTLYSAYRDLNSCRMNFPYQIDSHNDYFHYTIYHYYLKNPKHNVMLYDANYFFCVQNKYNNDMESFLKQIFFDKEINLEYNKDIKSIEIVFDSSIKEEVDIFNSLDLARGNILKKKICFALFDKTKYVVLNTKIL